MFIKYSLSVALACGMIYGATQQPKNATPTTVNFNKTSTASFAWNNTIDFENAKKGFIAPLANDGIVKDATGRVVWDLKRYQAFIKDGVKSPDTVNPSLWRMSQLLMYSGLFEVVPGVYQVRGIDLSNITFVEGDTGVTVYDPLISAETAKAALELYYQHRPKRPIVAVVYSHSHVDHFGGVRGIINEDDVKAGKVKIYAPEGFLDEAISENVFVGVAMSRRATYMYGNLVAPSTKGMTTAGLGVTTSTGDVTLVVPTDIIKTTGEKRTIDGIEYEFLMAPGSEAPSEMMWYMPKFKLINTAEDATHTMHNLYTLRGAKTRDAQKWPNYLNEVLKMWGDKCEVQLAMHHWPTWGNSQVNAMIKGQRDVYKFMHDQTLHYANLGYTMNELPALVTLPKGLVDDWGTHGYYGSQSHDVRAVYNYYLGFFDGNPAHLNPLPPIEVAKEYVEALGGINKVIALGQKAYKEGKYRWGAELMNHAVFADPNNQTAKNLQADMLEQMGYQTENGTWRGFYLIGANELRNGVQKLKAPSTASNDLMENMSLELIFAYMGIQLDAKKANDKKIILNFDFTDTKEKHALFLENSVLNDWSNYNSDKADATIRLKRTAFDNILGKTSSFEQEIKKGNIVISGNSSKVAELFGCLTDLHQNFWFNIVTP